MNLFRDFISLPLVRLGIYSSVVNFIRRDVLTKKVSPFTNITSAARVAFLLSSRIAFGISTYSVTTGLEVFLVVLPFRDAMSGPNIF